MTTPEGAQVIEVQPFRKKPRFEMVPFGSIKLNRTQRRYLVKGLLSNRGLSVIWGPPKCGKSFWALDLAMHISLGWQYRGRRVQGGAVVYIALEGQEGFKARVEAFRQHHQVEDAPFFLISCSLNLIADHGPLITEIKAQLPDGCKPAAVFIDTLNRSLVGSESKDEDMAKYLAAAEALASTLECKAAIIHHCGIDATRPRGHSSLTGSVEEQIAVRPQGEGRFSVTVEYAKDMAEGDTLHSRLQLMNVGKDPDGEPITSMIVQPADVAETSEKGKAVKGAKRIALQVLRKAINEAGGMPPASNHIPPNTRTISMEMWRSYAYSSSITESDEPDSKRKAFVRAAKDLQEASLVGKWGDLVWLVE